jgi:PAS domain-containing protein
MFIRSSLRKSEELFYIVISETLGRSIVHQPDLGERRRFFFFRVERSHIPLCRLLTEDNSMRAQAEDILLDSEERIRLILDSASEAICGCDSEGTCLFSNPSAARIL